MPLITTSLCVMSMIWMVVEAGVIGLATSEQLTTVPFKPMLTESIDSIEMRGKDPGIEVNIKLSLVELTVLFDI